MLLVLGSHFKMTSKTNRLRFVDYLGVEAATSHRGNPYFFLFDEIDRHNNEELRTHLNVFIERNLPFFWYSTKKGWHIISPALLSLKRWDSARKELQLLRRNHYPNLVIRIEYKTGDSRCLFFENLDFEQKYLVSSDLVDLYAKKFRTRLNIPLSSLVKSKLLFTHYTQVLVK